MAERTNPHANLIIGAQDEATPVFEKVKASSQSMAAGVEQAATKAAGAVGGIGDQAAPAAQKLDSVTSSMIRQVQRLNAELEAGGARNAAYIEKMASVKGADLSALAPYLADLKKAEAAQRVATTGLDNMGMSAKQTTAALRQVPMQFTDIVVSLQGGQSAMQVFLQQGGQLKDMFGGAGNAVRAMGGYVAGLVNPFTMAAAAIATIAVAYKQGSAEADGYRMALVMTGNAAGTTAAQMQQMAGRISSVVGTQGAAAEALAQMASNGRVASQSLEYFSEVAIKFERTTGTAISETVKRFAELGASPVDASRKLNEETNYLTASIYEQIKALKDQGREADAAALAQTTYADALNNRSAQITQNLGAIEGAWKAIKDAAKSGWDAMLNVGRADSLGTQIDNLRAKIAQAKGQDKNRPFSMPWDTSLADLEKQLSFLTEQERVIRRGAEAQAQRTQAEKEAIAATDALQKTQASGLTNQQKMNKALEEYARHIEKLKATNPASVLLSPDAIARGEKAIRDQFADKGKGSAGPKAVNKDLENQAKLIAELNGLTGGFAEEWDRLSAAYARGAMSMEELTKEQATLLARQPAIKAAAEEEAKARQAVEKADIGAAAAREKYVASLISGLDKIQADIVAQQEATARMGLSKEAIADLDAAKLEMLATDLELQAIKAMDRNLDQQTYDALKKQAAAYRELGIAKKGGAAKEAALDLEKANADAAKKAQEDWERAAEQINSSLTDALLRGFESGKDFAKNLRDTVVNMFKTMILRPVISAVLSPVSMALSGLTGAGSAAAGQAGGSALGSAGGSLMGSALGGIGAFGTGASYGATSLFANGLTGTLAAGGQMIGAGSVMSGLGTIAGALGPIAIGIALLSSLIKKSTPHMGAASNYSEAGGLVSNADVYQSVGFRDARTYNAEAASVTGGVAKAIGDALNSTARAFGKTAGYEITTAFADDKSKDGAWGSLIVKQMGQAVLDWRDTQTSEWAPKEFADGEAGQKEYMQAISISARDALKTAIGEVEWATDMLDALGDSPSLEGLAQTVDQINAASVALGKMRQNLDGFGGLTESAVSALVKAAGSMDSLIASASSYYDNFYSDSEKIANTTRDVSDALSAVGLQMPTTRDEFRKLVEAQMALGESGATAVAALLGVSGAFASITAATISAQAAERSDRISAQRAADKAQAEALQKQIDTFKEGAEQFNTLRDSLLNAGDAAGLLAAVTERAFADPSGKYMNGKYANPQWEATDTAASFNYKYGEMQARMRQQLGDEASANALRIENVAGVLQAYSVEQMMSEYDTVTGPIKLAIQQAIVDASGDLGYAVRDAVQGAALYAAMADVRGQFTSSGPGLASIAAARATAADASRTSIDPATGLYRIGGAAVEYGKALDNLQGRMRSGAIDADTFDRAVEALGRALPGAAESVGTLEDAISAAQGAAYLVGTAGVNSIRHYFGSLAELTAEFAKAAADAQEPIAQTTAAIGRLNSAQYAFAESASAALQGFGGAGEAGRQALAGASQDISRAQMIAEAAGIASAAMTTADAAAAAAKLAQSPAFAELGAKGIRDAALLLDGVGQYNAEGFERAFVRISDALAKGSVTEDQYKALFDTALDMFEGVPEETRTLIDSMTRLRDAMSGFADGLLIDEQRTTLSAGATLAEMQRQYAQAFAGASTGDSEAIGKYQQLATTLLDKDLYSTRAEYNAAFGSVYGDARQLENIGINTLANAQGNAMVSELKDMNAKLNKRVEDLEKNLLAALAQIAKNTSDTSRGIEQQIVIAEATP